MSEAVSGAVDLSDCPTRRRSGPYNRMGSCRCTPCKACGFGPHMAIHGPRYGEEPGGEPYGHEYQPPQPEDSE